MKSLCNSLIVDFSLCLGILLFLGTASDIPSIYNRFQPQCNSHLPQSLLFAATSQGKVAFTQIEEGASLRAPKVSTHHQTKTCYSVEQLLQKNRYRHKHTPPLSTWDPSHSLKEEEDEEKKKSDIFLVCNGLACQLQHFDRKSELVKKRQTEGKWTWGVFLGSLLTDEVPVWEVISQQHFLLWTRRAPNLSPSELGCLQNSWECYSQEKELEVQHSWRPFN